MELVFDNSAKECHFWFIQVSIYLLFLIKASDKLLFLFSNDTLQQINKRLPITKEELIDINGITK
jgi:hypothetical protein